MLIVFDGISPEELDDIIDRINFHRGFGPDPAKCREEQAASELRAKIAKEQEEAARKAQLEEEYEEFKRLVRASKHGGNDLKPNGGWLKIRRFCFQLTPEIFELVG